MCHASWPMASTSWVWLLRAITVGSLSTIPRPLAYISVFAVPRSMARSLARPALPTRSRPLRPAAVTPAVPARVWGQRVELARELLHVRLHRARLAVPRPEDHRAQQRQHDSDAEIHEVGHCAGTSWTSSTSSISLTWLTGWLHSAQSLPPSHVSRFQMGTVVLSVSMQNRAASNASPRCGADTAISTDVSPTESDPTRWSTAMRPSGSQRC